MNAARQFSRGSWIGRAMLAMRLARARRRHVFLREEALPEPRIIESFEPGFAEGEAAYNGLGIRGATVYAAISTKQLHAGAHLYALERDALREVADLEAILGTARTIPQGKVHVDLAPVDDRLVGATHIGYYDPRLREERPGSAPGYADYPGGVFFAIERDERITRLGQAPAGEGIITMSADAKRGLLHALTWPGGLLLTHDLATGLTTNRGAVFAPDERICRSIGVVPETGEAFWCDASGAIFEVTRGRVASVSEQWRKIVWHPDHHVFYGVSWTTGTLFRFDPRALRCDDLATLHDFPAAASLAFALDGNRVHYLAPGPGILRRGEIQLATTVWSLTHDLDSRATVNHGPLRLAGGRWITQAQALVATNGKLVSICHVEVPERDRSPRAEHVRALRRDAKEFIARGYAEEMIVTRFDA